MGPERTVRAYDPPAAAVPDTSRYTEAMTVRLSREARALRLKCWYLGLTLLSLSWAGLMTWDNQRLAGKLVEVARHKPVYRLEQALDGHQKLVLLDDTLAPTKGVRLQAVSWWVRWWRRIGSDPVVLARDRAAGRARLVRAAAAKWDALLVRDLDPAEGWTRDVTDLRVEEQAFDPATGLGSFHVVWTETVYRDFEPRGRVLMSAAVVTLDGPPRDGALDGVSISGFSEPAAMPAPAGSPAPTSRSQP